MEVVGARHRGAGAVREQPALPGEHVDPVRGHRLLARDLQQPLLDHELGTARALLPRLEHEHHAPGELVPPRAQQVRRSHQPGHVQVVTARVHRPGGRGVLQPGLLGHRQPVHVAAQQHRGPGPGATQHRDHRGHRAPQGDLQVQPVQRVHDPLLGPREVVAHLRVGVQGAAQGHQLRLQGGGVLEKRHGGTPSQRERVGGGRWVTGQHGKGTTTVAGLRAVPERRRRTGQGPGPGRARAAQPRSTRSHATSASAAAWSPRTESSKSTVGEWFQPASAGSTSGGVQCRKK